MKFIKIIFLSILLQSCFDGKPNLNKSIVKVYVTRQPQDFESPWLRLPVVNDSMLAPVLKQGIFVPAGFIKDAILIEIELFDEVERYPVNLIFADYESNLALISKPTTTKFKLKELAVSNEEPKLQSDFKLFGLGENTQIFNNKATFIRATTMSIPDTHRSQTHYLFSSSGKSLMRGELILSENKILAYIINEARSELIGIPGFILNSFLKDKHNPEQYQGFASLDIIVDSLRDPTRIDYLGLKTDTKGVIIEHIIPTSYVNEYLKLGDVITEIDGENIDDNGNINHSKWDKINFRHLFSTKMAGDKLKLKLLRDGKSLTLSLPLNRFTSNRGLIHMNQTPEDLFLIYGGLVFQELSLDYLKIFGNDWSKRAPVNFVYLFQQENYKSELEGERVVFLNKVLPDAVNRGYQQLGNLIVDKVNNIKIHNFNEFKEALKAKPIMVDNQPFVKIDFIPGQGFVVLNVNEVSSAEQRIAKNYLTNK